MTTDLSPLEQARQLLRLKAPAGAEARVLRRVLQGEGKRAPERRPLRPLVLVFSLLVSATATAVGGPPLAHWVGSKLGIELRPGREVPPPASVPPRTTAKRTATPRAPVLSAASPSEATPSTTPPPAATVAADSSERPLTALHAAPAAPPASVSTAPTAPAEPPESALAREVAAYHEAAALVSTSPGLALVRLRAHREHFPNSALAPEVSLRIVQAFTALGREPEARREARSFVIRYPGNAKRAEMQAVADGAPLERPGE